MTRARAALVTTAWPPAAATTSSPSCFVAGARRDGFVPWRMERDRRSPKRQRPIIDELRGEFGRWEELVAGLSDDELHAPRNRGGWSIRDVVAHLMAWQQVSNARLEAVVCGGEPRLPDWLAGGDPDSEADVSRYNDAIHVLHRGRAWADVRDAWRGGFERLLRLAAAVPDADLHDAARFPWLRGHAPAAVLEGTLAHHREHRASLFPDRS
jgi:hypothetical protein